MEQTSFTPPTLEKLNELLPAYRFIDFIAKGGMGAVYRAVQISLDREVAIKILPPELSKDPDFHASFRTEARAMAKLNHPNLISIYDSGELDGMLYIVMEYVAGKSLYHSCWNKQIDPSEVKRIIIAICDGLSHAHENGIIHRDIKPANILLTPKVEPKIGDFGLAQAVGVKYEGIVMGTPGYAAPEIISNPEKMDRRSDIFAVGVILYEMLVGKIPAGGALPSQECGCSREFDTIYQNATHPNAAMRYADAKQMSTAIQAISDGDKSARHHLSAPPKGVPKLIAAGNSLPNRPANPMARSAPGARPMTAAQPVAQPIQVAKAVALVPAAKVVVEADEPAIAVIKPTPAHTPIASPRILVDDDDDDKDSPLVIPSFGAAKAPSSWPLIRNMMIICVLLVACVFAYQQMQIREKNVKQQEDDFARKDKEKAMADKQKLADQKNISSEPTQKPKLSPSPPKVVETPHVETPMEELERLRFTLSRGDRTQMPKGIKKRGDLDYLLIAEQMTWDEALHFSERHGACIAFPNNEDDLTFLSDMLKNEETIWLGGGKAGREEWYLLSGGSWPFAKKPAGAGNIATLSHLGMIQASNGRARRPFLICWQRDGSNPYTLDTLLSATSKSLDAQNPQFPPGTLALGSRMFLPIIRKMTFYEAQTLASAAGGHVAALSNEEESYWLDEVMERGQAPKGIWLNAELRDGSWKWGTAEPWSYAKWASNFPIDDDDATQIAFVPGEGWINSSPNEKLNGVLIEWSKDASVTPPSNATVDTGTKDLDALQAKAGEIIQTAKKTRDTGYAANIKKFTWDMDVWFRTLKPNDQVIWKQPYTAIKVACSEKIARAEQFADEDGNVPAIHQEMAKIHTYGLKNQGEIDAAYLAQVTKVRDAYVTKIKEFGAIAKNTGQTKTVEKLKSLLDDSEDAEAWADELEGE